MSNGFRPRAARGIGVAVLLSITSILLGAGHSAWGESASELQARLLDVQDEINAITVRIEEREDELEAANRAVARIQPRIKELQKQLTRLEASSVERARELYMSGNGQVLEVLFGSQSIGELSSLAESLSHVSLGETDVFVKLARTKSEVVALNQELFDNKRAAIKALEELEAEHVRQQALFKELAEAYDKARTDLLPSAAEVRASGGMFCPVAGPTSFVDSWGAPRSGHSHQGVDMMGAYRTPLVAIVAGSITYAAYNGSGGNMIFLSGDDGNAYWYMHNQRNLVTGGHVSAGQQIATLGDTGNAAGTPHLHFEYHPGGGSAVNPTPLVASIC